MRALTVRQPWAWAIVHGGKHVENRTRNLAGGYRGPVAIHAGLTEDDAAYDDDLIKAAFAEHDDSWTLLDELATGAVIGVVDLVDVHLCHQLGEAVRGADCCQPWGQHEYFEIRQLCEVEGTLHGAIQHLVLANPRPLPTPVPARGRLGLWTPDPELLANIQKALR